MKCIVFFTLVLSMFACGTADKASAKKADEKKVQKAPAPKVQEELETM